MGAGLLYKKSCEINKYISILIPTVGQVLDNENEYYSLVSALTSAPIDLMVPLDDVGVDFTTIDDYELFLLLFPIIRTLNTSLVFGDLDLSDFHLDTDKQNGSVVLYDSKYQVKIDRAIHGEIANILRRIHNIEVNRRKPANKAAKAFMLERARAKLKRHKNREQNSQLESLIVAMVNTEQYKYDFEGTRELSIYQFNESVKQVVKKVDYDNRMYGVYAGTINAKELSQDDLNWLTHK